MPKDKINNRTQSLRGNSKAGKTTGERIFTISVDIQNKILTMLTPKFYKTMTDKRDSIPTNYYYKATPETLTPLYMFQQYTNLSDFKDNDLRGFFTHYIFGA